MSGATFRYLLTLSWPLSVPIIAYNALAATSSTECLLLVLASLVVLVLLSSELLCSRAIPYFIIHIPTRSLRPAPFPFPFPELLLLLLIGAHAEGDMCPCAA